MGTGTRDMICRCTDAGLPEPEFGVSDGFQTIIRRVQGGEGPSGKTSGLILEMIRRQPEITIPEMAEALGKSTRAIEVQLAKYHRGPSRSGRKGASDE